MKRRIWLMVAGAVGVMLALLIQQSTATANDPYGPEHHHQSASATVSASVSATPTVSKSVTTSPSVTPTATPKTSPPVTPASTVGATPTVSPVGESLPVTGPGAASLIVVGLALVALGGAFLLFRPKRRRVYRP